MKQFLKPFLFFGLVSLSLTGCGDSGGGLTDVLVDALFPVEQDDNLGAQLDSQILANPSEYPILKKADYPQVYTYLEGMKNTILASEDVEYRDEFAWKLTVIRNDSVLNAFAAPGGYIYIYTGLINYLESADALAGVVGHEIAHADRRHSIRQLAKAYGVQYLLDVALGDAGSGTAGQVLGGLLGLQFSKDDETEADEYSVYYLGETNYACDGAARFFETIGSSGVPEFLSTHPNPDNRVANIKAVAVSEDCSTTEINESDYSYENLKADLASSNK